MRTCAFCHGIGWILDANGAGMVEPKSLELIRCIHPECEVSGAALASLVFKEPAFRHAALHPVSGVVMSVSA